MKSLSTTRPLGVRSSVRSTMVSSTYSRRDSLGSTVLSRQEPPGSPRMLAKQAAESNDGRQAQSIDPSRETSADPWQFESNA